MLSAKIEKALNDQVNRELYSSYIYLAMSAYFESKNYGGFAHWMKIQSEEEREHGMKIYDYINTRDGRVVLEAIQAPKKEWAKPLEAFEEAYAHEQYISKSINDIVTLAYEEKDHATVEFLSWFVKEQVEEEASSRDVVEKMKMVGESTNTLFLLDRELGKRA
ncbi:MAG: ferritin [Ignavibacteriaceae bacterium]|nr:ferritin [Ignavibacteriaceae bacterium]